MAKSDVLKAVVLLLSLLLAAPGERPAEDPFGKPDKPAAEKKDDKADDGAKEDPFGKPDKPAPEKPAEKGDEADPPKVEGEGKEEDGDKKLTADHIATLMVELDSDDATRRGAAAQTLGDAKAEAAIPKLLQLLDDPNEDAQWKATVALGGMGEAALAGLINGLAHEKERARWKAENALKMNGEVSVPALMKALSDNRVSVRQSVAFLLGEMKDPRSIEALAAAMADKDDDVRWKAATSLTKFGSRATEATVKQLKSPQIEARRCAAWVFQQTVDAGGATGLIAALKDRDDQVRWKAAIALQKIGAEAADPLLAILKSDAKETEKAIVAWILEGVKDVRVQTALRDIRPPKKPTTSAGPARPRPKVLPKNVVLAIDSEPAKATVFIDDKYAGVTPLTVVKLTPGHHFVKLTKRDHLPWTKLVELLYAEEKLNAKLAVKPKGTIAVTSEPSEADVYIDGEYEGKTPLEKKDVDANPYSVRVEKEHFVSYETEIEVRAGQVVKVPATLKSKVEGWYLAKLKENANDVSCHTELAHFYLVRGDLDKSVKSIAGAITIVGNGTDTSGYAGRLAQEIDKMWGETFQFGGDLKLEAVRKALHAGIHECYKAHKNKEAVARFLGQLRKSTKADFTQPPKG